MIGSIISSIFGNETAETDSEQTDDELDEQPDSEAEPGTEPTDTQSGLPNMGRQHRDVVAPTVFREKRNKARVGDSHMQMLFMIGWPDEPDMMYLHSLLYALPIKSDISVHVNPRKKDKALQKLESDLEKAKSRAEGGVTLSNQQARQQRLQETERAYQSVKQTNASLHEVGMYITIRGDEEEELELAVEEIVRELRKMSLEPEVLRDRQREGIKTVSPDGRDYVGYKHPMLSGAVGRMYPFGTTRIIESGGIDIGEHAANRSPIVIDRFGRKNGYNQITAGKIGSGKTFGTLLEILRTKAAHGDDLVVFMLDPLRGFKPVANLLDCKEVLVGGDVGLNPMRITETPDIAFEESPDLNPYGEKKDNLIDFFGMFFAVQNRELGESRDVLEVAIDETYKRAGITQDPDTHDKESPTITELIEVISEIATTPEAFANAESEKLVDDFEEFAARLLRSFAAFEEGGQYEHLSQQTELGIENEDTVYFNLSQKEGSGKIGLMMQLLLSEVYNRAKETDKNVLFCIDEARYIMSDAKSLEFLEQAVRHSRHYDLSINFITQTIEEFFSHESSEAIVQQCSMRRIHRLESGLTEDIKNTLNLEDSHVDFIQSAEPGSKEAGYSEALIGVDEYGYVPARIRPSAFELDSIEAAESEL